MITIILLALFAIVLCAVFIDQRKALDHITDFEARMVESMTGIKKGLENRIDRYIETHNATVDHYDSEIDEIIARMNQITEDIKRIDHDEKDLRKYYVNYTSRSDTGAGVSWAKDYPDREEEEKADE